MFIVLFTQAHNHVKGYTRTDWSFKKLPPGVDELHFEWKCKSQRLIPREVSVHHQQYFSLKSHEGLSLDPHAYFHIARNNTQLKNTVPLNLKSSSINHTESEGYLFRIRSYVVVKYIWMVQLLQWYVILTPMVLFQYGSGNSGNWIFKLPWCLLSWLVILWRGDV